MKKKFQNKIIQKMHKWYKVNRNVSSVKKFIYIYIYSI